jgi:hypothetical protein
MGTTRKKLRRRINAPTTCTMAKTQQDSIEQENSDTKPNRVSWLQEPKSAEAGCAKSDQGQADALNVWVLPNSNQEKALNL